MPSIHNFWARSHDSFCSTTVWAWKKFRDIFITPQTNYRVSNNSFGKPFKVKVWCMTSCSFKLPDARRNIWFNKLKWNESYLNAWKYLEAMYLCENTHHNFRNCCVWKPKALRSDGWRSRLTARCYNMAAACVVPIRVWAIFKYSVVCRRTKTQTYNELNHFYRQFLPPHMPKICRHLLVNHKAPTLSKVVTSLLLVKLIMTSLTCNPMCQSDVFNNLKLSCQLANLMNFMPCHQSLPHHLLTTSWELRNSSKS